jgi:hypothetical protein
MYSQVCTAFGGGDAKSDPGYVAGSLLNKAARGLGDAVGKISAATERVAEQLSSEVDRACVCRLLAESTQAQNAEAETLAPFKPTTAHDRAGVLVQLTEGVPLVCWEAQAFPTEAKFNYPPDLFTKIVAVTELTTTVVEAPPREAAFAMKWICEQAWRWCAEGASSHALSRALWPHENTLAASSADWFPGVETRGLSESDAMGIITAALPPRATVIVQDATVRDWFTFKDHVFVAGADDIRLGRGDHDHPGVIAVVTSGANVFTAERVVRSAVWASSVRFRVVNASGWPNDVIEDIAKAFCFKLDDLAVKARDDRVLSFVALESKEGRAKPKRRSRPETLSAAVGLFERAFYEYVLGFGTTLFLQPARLPLTSPTQQILNVLDSADCTKSANPAADCTNANVFTFRHANALLTAPLQSHRMPSPVDTRKKIVQFQDSSAFEKRDDTAVFFKLASASSFPPSQLVAVAITGARAQEIVNSRRGEGTTASARGQSVIIQGRPPGRTDRPAQIWEVDPEFARLFNRQIVAERP